MFSTRYACCYETSMLQSYIAIIPLVVYVSGFLSSLVMKSLNICAGRKVTVVMCPVNLSTQAVQGSFQNTTYLKRKLCNCFV